ncbi:MAG: exonuclease domain-containing protein [Clostridia bacterium]|nr:exonuclease domain-containing protein [Clostridia bacterium]
MGKYVVYDLEMCRVPTKEARDAFGSRQELIQIGAVLLNESYEITDSFITYVKPRYGQIDSFIEKLTGIKPSDVIDAPSTEEALDSFLRWIPDDATMVSWSLSDPGQLYHEIDGKGIDLPRLEDLLEESIDCQYEFEEKIEATRPYGLSEALSITGIDCDENIHDALTDASNTALLFRKIMEEPVLSMSKYYLSENDMSEYMHNAGFRTRLSSGGARGK